MRQRKFFIGMRYYCSILIVITIMVAGCATRQTFWGFNKQSPKEWTVATSHWRTKASISVEHTAGKTGGAFKGFAQSFTPHCKVIEAVELCTYPVNAPGWIRVDIAKDKQGMPGQVLSRCWLRVEKDCPITHSGYMIFLVPKVKVDPDEIYWITFNEYPERQYVSRYSMANITNLGFSGGATYQEGNLLLKGEEKYREIWDAKFRIISKCDAVPNLRRVPRRAQRTLPVYSYQKAPWQNASSDWCKYVLREKAAQTAKNRGQIFNLDK